ncbi:MAG TPA: class I SAM-dependent methyltransferase [Burkholderiaceae bacterium]|nr:class I SAM-dependent methyltransferase [Burkholderiaceae bacterium]
MNTDAIPCRLCAAPANFKFARQAKDGDDVRCYECSACHSLQTEVPYWLEAEYAASAADTHLNLDTYAADRSLRSRTAVYFLWKFAGFKSPQDKLLDWGGGVGLMVRLLRDAGIDAYLYDKYAKNHFASGFIRSEHDSYSVVTAFEVFEHFANPVVDLQAVFSLDPALLVISTGVYTNQGADWPYLGPAKSEHVFFYSEQALELIGHRFGYGVIRLRHGMTLFFKDPIAAQRLRWAGRLLSRDYLADIAFALIRKRSHCDADNQKIRAKTGELGA